MNFASKVRLWVLIVGDVLALYLALFLTLMIRYGADFYSQFIQNHFMPFSLIFISWLLVFYIAGLYNFLKLRNGREFLKILGLSLAVNAVLSILFFYLVPSFHIAPKTNLFLFLIIFIFLEIFWRRFYNNFFASKEALYKVLLIGGGEVNEEIISVAEKNPQIGYEISSWLKEGLKDQEIKHLHQIILEKKINLIVIPLHLKKDEKTASLFYELLGLGFEIWDLPRFYEEIFQKTPLIELEESWFLENLTDRIKFYDSLKRGFEVLFSLALLIILSPLEILIAILIKFTSLGPVIYKQERTGELGKNFYLYKFRTMVKDAEKGEAEWAAKNDSRTTFFGRFLRYSHLDELPQLYNILKGDLSFIGPRPERPELIKMLEEKIPYYKIRHLVKPGITGWAQINYHYGASVEDAYEKLKYDIFYIKNRSIFLDLLIALKTLRFFLINEK